MIEGVRGILLNVNLKRIFNKYWSLKGGDIIFNIYYVFDIYLLLICFYNIFVFFIGILRNGDIVSSSNLF